MKQIFIMGCIILLAASCTKVTELTVETEIPIIVENTTLEEDQAILEELLLSINTIAESESCEKAKDWKFTAIGHKSCGGAAGYIAYPKKIDETDFLEKVRKYTQAQREFNIKWSIPSTCEIRSEPKSISCVDGKAMLQF